jgi:hypothetical protein
MDERNNEPAATELHRNGHDPRWIINGRTGKVRAVDPNDKEPLPDHSTLPEGSIVIGIHPDRIPFLRSEFEQAGIPFPPKAFSTVTGEDIEWTGYRAEHHIAFTVLTKSDGPLTKRISLAGSDGSGCRMVRGTARREHVTSMGAFGDVIRGLGSDQAITLGVLRGDLPDSVTITTKRKLNGATSLDRIARTASNFRYAADTPALALLDYDTKAMPPDVAERIAAFGGVWPALVAIMPELAGAARVVRASTSAGLFRSDTGEKLPGSSNSHVYILARNGGDIDRFLRALHERCWLAGLGWYMVGKAGQLLERSIIDRMVGAAARLRLSPEAAASPPSTGSRNRRSFCRIIRCPAMSSIRRTRPKSALPKTSCARPCTPPTSSTPSRSWRMTA